MNPPSGSKASPDPIPVVDPKVGGLGTVSIGAGEAREIELAGLVFRARQRAIGDDGGPSLEILAGEGDALGEVIRFDIFERDPHFHSPASDPKPTPLCDLAGAAFEGRGGSAAVAHVVDELPNHLGPLLERAGRPDLASGLDPAILRDGRGRLMDLLRDLPRPQSLRAYPLTDELRRQLGMPPSEEP